MSKKDKLITRFLRRPKDFTYKELAQLLGYFDYEEIQGAGSRVRFNNPKLNSEIKIHKPHPSPIIKRYVLDLVLDELTKLGIL